MAIKYTNISCGKTLQTFPKLGFFGLKICRLATLLQARYHKNESCQNSHFFTSFSTKLKVDSNYFCRGAIIFRVCVSLYADFLFSFKR
jgi:hypothetical protein